MQAWWRVLRGVWPYRWTVVISFLCAMGVGLSYASGLAVMLPVMKIFVSTEGIQGWANRTAAESRLDASIWDLDTNIRYKVTGVVINTSGKKANAGLKIDRNEIVIHDVIIDGQSIDQDDKGIITPEQWQATMSKLAHLAADKPVVLRVRFRDGGKDLDPVTLSSLPPASLHARALLIATDHLATNPTKALIQIVGVFIILCLVGSVFRYYQQFLGMNVANRVIMDLRRKMYDRVLNLPTSFFAQKGTADIMSRLTSNTNTLTDGVAMAFGKAIQEPIKAAAALITAFILDWKLTLMIVVSVPFLGLLIRKFSKHMRKASRKALESWALMLGIVNETLIAARVVKAYSAGGFERRRFSRINKRLLKEQKKLNHYNALSRPVIETLAVILTSIPMLVAAHWVLQGKVDKEAFFTLLVLFGAMLEPMRKLADVNARVQQSNAAATRVFEVIDMEPEPNIKNDLPKLARHARNIEFKDITFSYPGHTEVVLQNVSFNVLAGQSVAVVGGNGSGKTTLLNLVSRLYIPTSGQILVDGVDTATVSVRSLRRQIGLVTQDTLLFADTIYNNIAYGSRHATEDQVMEASRRSYADEFIRGLPDGYKTRVGEHGVRLSGGQKQRIAIARAILREPAILILDEAMSQIDSDSEAKITTALQAFTKDRTTFVIAHRFSTVVNADMIVCLDHGNVVGIGTHTQLLDSCLQYRKLYENQFHDSAA
jgi:ATP-binding cassette, subfamily B, bacterial MsbA